MRLDAQTPDIVIFLKEKGFQLSSPLDIKFIGEEAHVGHLSQILVVTRGNNGKLTYKQKKNDSLNETNEVIELFDTISGASYHGMLFRNVLRNDPHAREAARILAKALKDNHVID